MRERSTWTQEDVVAKVAAAKKAAEKPGDVYTMNQDHPQPGFDAYVIGDPSDFAEDVHSPNEWEKEYKGDEVKRNEIGMPEMRPETFSHSEKTASREVMLKKADLCVAIATLMLQGRKTASESAIEDQAVALMYLPDHELINTHARLASEQDDEGDEGQEQGDKQAGQIPEAFKENIEKMKAKSEDKKDDDKDQGEKKQAQQQQGQGQAQESDEAQEKQAQDQDDKDEDKSDEKPWESKQATQNMMAQMQQMQAQLQQMMQAFGQPQQQQAPVAQEQELDQLLAADSCGPMAESDIQMDPFMDDMGGEGQEDETLKALFASDDEQQEDQQQSDEQQVQAAVRTASTRTVGTRPSAGVSKIGGTPKVASNSSVDSLSSLWVTAPDVRGAFGLK